MSHFPARTLPTDAGSLATELATDLILAVESGNPAANVLTPGYGRAQTTLADLLSDELAGDNFLCHGLLAMWAQGLKSSDVAMRMQSMALLSEWQRRHVAFHLDDAMAEACAL